MSIKITKENWQIGSLLQTNIKIEKKHEIDLLSSYEYFYSTYKDNIL